jgi:hypothetical protein
LNFSNLFELTTLHFGFHFNQSINCLKFFKQLKFLKFDYYFNQNIEPLSHLTNLEFLEFGFMFNNSIIELQNLNLKILNLPFHFHIPIQLKFTNLIINKIIK